MKMITHVEIVLFDSEKIPDELLVLSENWKYLAGSIYIIAQTSLTRELSTDEQALLTQLKDRKVIIDGTSLTRTITIDTAAVGLPEWAEP